MARKTVEGVSADAKKLLVIWEDHPDLTFGDINKSKIQMLLNALTEKDDEVERNRVILTKLMDQRDDLLKELKDVVTRSRSAIRGIFGTDSKEFDQAGCTRKSERKPSKPKTEGKKTPASESQPKD